MAIGQLCELHVTSLKCLAFGLLQNRLGVCSTLQPGVLHSIVELIGPRFRASYPCANYPLFSPVTTVLLTVA